MSESVPAKRGRKPDPIYGKLVELFMEDGSEAFEIDWRAMGRKPDAVQHGLNAAIKRLDLGDTLRVSLLDGGGKLLLRRRTAGPSSSKPGSKRPAAVRTSTAGLGVEGLVFENGFVSISEDEWERRFPLRETPGGERAWDTHGEEGEFVRQQDEAYVWTQIYTEEGRSVHSGYRLCDRDCYFISTIPVPTGLNVQAWDDPFPEEDFEFLRSAVAEWQNAAGVATDAIAKDEFAEWWWKTYPGRDEIERDGYYNKLSDIGISEVFENLADYRSARERPEPGSVEPELVPFVVHIEEFISDEPKYVRLPQSSMEPTALAGLVNRAIGRLGVADQVSVKVSHDRVWLSKGQERAGYTSLDFAREESFWLRSDPVPGFDVGELGEASPEAACEEIAVWFLERRLPAAIVLSSQLAEPMRNFLGGASLFASQVEFAATEDGFKLTRLEDWTIPSHDDFDYAEMVAKVLHRGFGRMSFEFEPGEADSEELRRGFERAIEDEDETDRLTVNVLKPTCVLVKLKDGHREPKRVPRKLGLDRWVKPIEGFIFTEDFATVLFIDPESLTLEEELAQTITAVRALELDDFLTVDGVNGRVRVRRTRDVE